MMREIPPGSTIGVLGSGQLGRMFAIAARRLGYRVHTLSPDSDTPLGQVADVEIAAAYDDMDAVRAFARAVDVVTFEFENVPAAAADAAEAFAPVRPQGALLHMTQERVREKSALAQAGFAVTPFRPVASAADLRRAAAEIGPQGVLKSATWGYDGRGQRRVDRSTDLDAAWAALDVPLAVFERFIEFEREVSVVGARGLDGSFAHFGVIENTHRAHILHTSVAPAHVPQHLAQHAVEMTREIMRRWEVVGVLCVEFFLTASGELLINELAPRPHNSGHLTIDACRTCQFEQQVRAVCGLPLGDPRMHGPAAMVNLMGDLWSAGPPDWSEALGTGEIKLHLYGKGEARAGRKMGHLTALAETPAAALKIVSDAWLMLAARTRTICGS